MIKQQRILIIALAVVFAVLAAAYFIVVRPLTSEEETKAGEEVVPDPGEDVSVDRLLVFPQIERKNMQSIEVHNEHGSYKFVYEPKFDDFVIEGYETLAYDPIKFSQLVVNTGYTLTLAKITNNATEDELEEYGFKGGETEPAYYILTTRDGESRKVIIGEKIISGGGYYAMYEGRDAIYILDSSLETSVLSPVEYMVTPTVTGGVSITTYYMVDKFTIKHYGEDFIVCRNRTEEELKEMETTAIAEAITVYPAEYTLSTYYDDALQTLAAYEGDSVAALGLTDEHLEEYGLADEPYVISYEYQGFKFRLIVSEPEDGYYYVATEMFDMIVKVPEADFEFLKWDLMHWINSLVFSRNITFVDNIKLESEALNETFRFRHYPNDAQNLAVIGDDCGEIRNVGNFRQFYKTLLLLNIVDYAPEDVEVTEDDCVLRFTVSTVGGSETEYAFYRYSTRRCLLTINGHGQFYVLYDTAQKIISDAEKAIAGIEINATDKN